MKPDYQAHILNFITKNSGIEKTHINVEKNFVEAGYLDSLDIYNLLLSLEKDSGEKLNLTELVGDFPCTISKLVSRLQK